MEFNHNVSEYHPFFNLSSDMLCIIDIKKRLLEVNTTFRNTSGFGQEILSTCFLEYIHPDDFKSTTNILNKICTEQKNTSFECRFKCKNSTYLTFSWNVVFNNEKEYFYLAAQNITKQINITNELNQFKSAFYNNTIYTETDIKGNITAVNQKFCDITGYTENELIGENHRLINSGAHPKEFFTTLWKTISSGTVWSGVIQNKKKNGDPYYVQSILIPVLDHNDKIIKYISTRQDITNQINTNYNYQKTLDILKETGSIGKIGGWEMEIASGELLWTDETFKILDVEQTEGIRPKLPDGLKLFIERDQPIIEEAVKNAAEHGIPYSLELEVCTPKGDIKWIYTSGKANYKDGKIDSLSGIIQDIHEKKTAEIKLNEVQQQSIHNAKFAALGELSASIAHEINNPLGIIYGHSELMQMSANAISADKLTSQTNTILKSCDRIAHIVKSLKKFSRDYEVEPKKVLSLKKIINEVLILTEPKLKQQMINLKDSNIDDGNILCNEIEIEQVLVNLVNNAIDAISNLDNKWIQLSVKNTVNNLHFSIVDSGKGIPKEKQLLIFEPFYTSKGNTTGTGLGLSIVKEILSEHNATIKINSDTEHTCFEIDFPKYNRSKYAN